MKTLLSIVISIVWPVALAATPTITDVTAQQRYPWNGKVDITYTITDAMPVAAFLKVSATDRSTGSNYVASASAISGDVGLNSGTHRIVWDMSGDGLALKSEDMVFKVSCEVQQYCIIDLSAGSKASSYPVTYLWEAPSGGFNTDEYKATKMVLRRIEAGSFIMGENQNNNSHRVTLTKPFYCGIFEVTEKQYSLVMGTVCAYGDTFPKGYMSYDSIRGSLKGAEWPLSSDVDSSSFMGKLRARTGLDFDLPTDAQWEYACRAGTTTVYYWGNSISQYGDNDYAWLRGNSGESPHIVGTKLPNSWGLYDMCGNMSERCLDWYAQNVAPPYGTDPKGIQEPANNATRIVRGGSWVSVSDTDECRSGYRAGGYAGNSFKQYGFRIVRTISE